MSWELTSEEEWTPVTMILAAGDISDENPGLPTYASRLFLGTPERALKVSRLSTLLLKHKKHSSIGYTEKNAVMCLQEAGFENVHRKEMEVSEEGKALVDTEPSKEDDMEPYRYIFSGTKPV